MKCGNSFVSKTNYQCSLAYAKDEYAKSRKYSRNCMACNKPVVRGVPKDHLELKIKPFCERPSGCSNYLTLFWLLRHSANTCLPIM